MRAESQSKEKPDMDFAETLKERIKELRVERGLSQEELAKQTGLSRSAISAWENGTRVPAVTAVAVLAEFFGASTDSLLGLEN